MEIWERYLKVRLLGEGGGGEVWEAKDLQSQEHVAVKVLHPQNMIERSRFEREIGALKALRVPGVVRLRSAGIEQDIPWMVMDLIQGTPFPGISQPDWPALRPLVERLLSRSDVKRWGLESSRPRGHTSGCHGVTMGQARQRLPRRDSV